MTRKQVTILLVLVVALGSAGWFIHHRGQASFEGAGRSDRLKLLPAFPYNSVTQISIKQGTNEVNLVKKDIWRLRERSDYPANYSDLSKFLLKLPELNAQRQQAGPSQLPRLQLATGQGSNSPVVVDLKDKDGKSINSLLLGKTQMKKSNNPSPMGDMGDEGFPTGRWVKLASESDTVAFIGDPLDTIAPKPEQWLNKDFFKVDKLKSVSVTYPVASNSFKVFRETENAADWKLADAKPGEQLDPAKTSSFNYGFNPSFSDVLPGEASPQQTGLDNPTVVSLATFDGFIYTLKVGAKTNENYPMTLAISPPPIVESATNIANAELERLTAEVIAQQVKPGTNAGLTPDMKEQLQKKIDEARKKSLDKLTQERAFEKWTYLVSYYTLESVLKERAQLLAEKKEAPKTEDGSSTNSVGNLRLDELLPKAEGK